MTCSMWNCKGQESVCLLQIVQTAVEININKDQFIILKVNRSML
jgi:hypothetical protein